MSKWGFDNYAIYEETDVLRFEDDRGDVIGYVINDEGLTDELDAGIDPIAEGWEDGNGNTVNMYGWGSEERNFFYVGTWWNDKNTEMYEIEDDVYALYGWNGETFTESWRCTGELNMDASEERYSITPQYDDGDEYGNYNIIRYEVAAN